VDRASEEEEGGGRERREGEAHRRRRQEVRRSHGGIKKLESKHVTSLRTGRGDGEEDSTIIHNYKLPFVMIIYY
jgi:hypothetical protein